MRFAIVLLRRTCLVGLAAFLCAAFSSSVTRGQEFRVETDVFVDPEKEPVVETLTIFSNGIVYDFLLSGVEEITFFDREKKRLVLMDTKREVKTELTTDSILSFIAQMKAHMVDSRPQFLVGKAAQVHDGDDGWLELSNDRVTYRVKGVSPKEDDAARQFQQFADWYARLNAMRHNLPPFFRIHLNSVLASKGLIPKTIERTIVSKRGLTETKQTLRSRHLTNWRLSVTDRRMIDRAATNLATYRTISFRDYVQLPAVAAK